MNTEKEDPKWTFPANLYGQPADEIIDRLIAVFEAAGYSSTKIKQAIELIASFKEYS